MCLMIIIVMNMEVPEKNETSYQRLPCIHIVVKTTFDLYPFKSRLHMAHFKRARPGTEPDSVPGPDTLLFTLSGPGSEKPGGQERNLLVVPIVSNTMYEANYFTSPTDNEHRSACCQKQGSFSGPAASIVSFNCEGLSEAKEVLIAEMCRTNSCVALCIQETHRTDNSRHISINVYSVIYEINHPKHGSAMLVRNDTVSSSVKGTVHAGTELIAATFGNVTVPSIYKPPPAKLTFPPDFFDMNRNNIIIGDFNSHNHLWGYRDDDENVPRGVDLHEQRSPHPRRQAAEHFQQREVEARLQP